MRKIIELSVAGGSLLVLVLSYGTKITNYLGIFSLPDDLRKALVIMSTISTTATWLLLILGFGALGFLAYDSGWFSHALPNHAAVSGNRRRVRAHQMLPIVGMVIGASLLIGCTAWALIANARTNSEILHTLSRYVLPRHLSDDQINIVKEYLLQHEPQDYKFEVVRNNEEAGIFRSDIQKALTLGGWKVLGFDYPDSIQEGLSLYSATVDPAAPPKKENAQTLLQEAFKKAKIRIDGGGAGGTNPTLLTLKIGARRRDDGMAIAKQNQREMIRRIEEDYYYADE